MTGEDEEEWEEVRSGGSSKPASKSRGKTFVPDSIWPP